MRTLAVGDIHGCLKALRTLEALVPFGDDDQLVFLGDYVDKGPDCRGVLDWLCDRQDQDGDRCITLRGNHDLMMLEARRSAADFEVWMSCNGDTTLASYGLPPVRASLDRVPVRHWRFLEQTRLYHEADRQFFVHGNVYPDLPLDEQPSYMLLWEKFYDPVPHASGKRMVCGHTSQKDGRIADLGHSTCIDTWACGDGWLTALDPDSDRYWKANQAGATQTGRLGGA
jgi:serine/threonine protein phosphatase 1